MRLIDADKLKPDCLTNDGHLAITQSQIAAAETFEGVQWIPIKTRPLTEEEYEQYGGDAECEVEFMYDCPIPEDGEEVLITTDFGTVQIDTFCRDSNDGCFFESYYGEYDVKAWARMPKPWRGEE